MKTQMDYIYETNERLKRSQMSITRVADIPPLTERELAMIENAYRRGYFQGYYNALDDSEHSGKTFAKLMDWVNSKLFRWRYAKHGGDMTEPPTPGRSK